MTSSNPPVDPSVEDAFAELIEDYRDRCLWFLREDYRPSTLTDRLKVLGYIERYGDRAAFRRAREIRRWLSHPSSEKSAVS